MTKQQKRRPRTDAALDVDCPTCHAKPGKWCLSLAGDRALTLHKARLLAGETP